MFTTTMAVKYDNFTEITLTKANMAYLKMHV